MTAINKSLPKFPRDINHFNTLACGRKIIYLTNAASAPRLLALENLASTPGYYSN